MLAEHLHYKPSRNISVAKNPEHSVGSFEGLPVFPAKETVREFFKPNIL